MVEHSMCLLNSEYNFFTSNQRKKYIGRGLGGGGTIAGTVQNAFSRPSDDFKWSFKQIQDSNGTAYNLFAFHHMEIVAAALAALYPLILIISHHSAVVM